MGPRVLKNHIQSENVSIRVKFEATLDILKNAKNAVKNAALNKIGSSKILQAREMADMVERSKIPLGVGEN